MHNHTRWAFISTLIAIIVVIVIFVPIVVSYYLICDKFQIHYTSCSAYVTSGYHQMQEGRMVFVESIRLRFTSHDSSIARLCDGRFNDTELAQEFIISSESPTTNGSCVRCWIESTYCTFGPDSVSPTNLFGGNFPILAPLTLGAMMLSLIGLTLICMMIYKYIEALRYEKATAIAIL